MNISHKNLSNNCLSNSKIQYYQKIMSKYSIAFIKIQKDKKFFVKYRKHVLDWLFSYDLETRMIICCVENKRYTQLFEIIDKKKDAILKYNSNLKYYFFIVI